MCKRPAINFPMVTGKLNGPNGPVKTARLLAVMQVHSDRISKSLMDYDGFSGPYIPTPGFYLILLFQKSPGDLFTTIRMDARATGNRKSKFDYYYGLIGQEFDVIINAHSL